MIIRKFGLYIFSKNEIEGSTATHLFHSIYEAVCLNDHIIPLSFRKFAIGCVESEKILGCIVGLFLSAGDTMRPFIYVCPYTSMTSTRSHCP